jgi:TonB-dependent starch-binding outer membrane protein SusC
MRSKFKWIFTLLVAFTMQFSFAQEKTVTGVVSDESGPLPGANVVVKGTNRSTQTDFDGKYSIKANVGETLVFSFTGYQNQSQVIGSSSKISVKLTEGIVLENIVVEGYRTNTKTKTTVAQTTINSKTIENRPNASVVQTLQGQIAGVNIASGSGQPGAASTVIIRGQTTREGSTSPLYLIDNVPSSSDSFRNIDPNEIASVTVLKDAAATAIYGNRAANGVIVIKTKSAKYGEKLNFSYSMNTGLTQLQNYKYDLADARQQLTLERTVGRGRGNQNPATGEPFTDAEIAAYNVNTDWVKYFFRTGLSQQHQLSISGGSENLNSFTSIGYLNQEGILRTTGLQRFNFRNNISGKSKDDKFNFSSNVGLSFSKNNQATSLGTGGVNRNYVLGATLGVSYISPDEYQNSQQLLDLNGEDGTLKLTPLFLIDKLNTYFNETSELRILGNFEASYKLTKDITALTRTSVDFNQTRFIQTEFPVSFNALLFQDPGEDFVGFEDINSNRFFNFNFYNSIRWDKKVKDHSFSLSANTEYYKAHGQLNNFRQSGLDPLTFSPGTSAGYAQFDGTFYVPQVSAINISRGLFSYFGQGDYDYKNRYGATATIRRDTTSKFENDYKWGTFWALSARWNISNEEFMKDSVFDELKLRVSKGATGNERITNISGGVWGLYDGTQFSGILGPILTRDVYSISNNTASNYNGAPSLVPSIGDTALRWETTYQTNVGIDFGVFKNRLRGAADVYEKKTVDLFIDAPLSYVTGQAVLTQNYATIINKGIELQLSYDLIKNNNTRFTLNFNGSYNDNRIFDIPNDRGEIPNGNVTDRNGRVLNEFIVYPYAGVNPLNGNLLFLDINNNLTENPDPDADRRYTNKSRLPRYQGGFGFDFEYKGFYANTLFTYVADIWRFDFDLEGMYDSTTAGLGQFRSTTALFDAWTPTNTNTNVPALNASNFGLQEASDRFLRDASYVRLRNFQVGYNFPKKTLERTFIKGLKLFAQGENFLTFTKWQGFDPESNRSGDQAQYPTPRIFTVGLDIKF